MKDPLAWQKAAVQIASGCSAGLSEISVMYPLDIVKTRLQLQHKPTYMVAKNDFKSYTGIVDCLYKMYKFEGPFSFWKGMLAPMVAETPKRAIKFCSFEQFKTFFTFKSNAPMTFIMAGLAAGCTEAVFVNPFEVVKVTMQANKGKANDIDSTWLVTRRIIKENGWGPKGLSKGMTATVIRNGVFNACYLGFYNYARHILPPIKDPVQEFGSKVVLGFISGTLASCMNIPFDVAKSRIQGPQPVIGKIKYASTTTTIFLVYKEEGIGALYKGLMPKILRLGPGGAIMLVVYDYMSIYLTQRFIDY